MGCGFLHCMSLEPNLLLIQTAFVFLSNPSVLLTVLFSFTTLKYFFLEIAVMLILNHHYTLLFICIYGWMMVENGLYIIDEIHTNTCYNRSVFLFNYSRTITISISKGIHYCKFFGFLNPQAPTLFQMWKTSHGMRIQIHRSPHLLIQ